MRKVAGVLLAVASVLPIGLASSSAGASTQPPTFTFMVVTPSPVVQGHSFSVKGAECTDDTQVPLVQPTGTMVFTNLTTGAALGTKTLTFGKVSDSENNCSDATVTDSETLKPGLYRIQAEYVPGGSIPVQASPAAVWGQVVTGPTICKSQQPCSTSKAASASVTYPGLTVTVNGTPTHGAATIDLSVALATLACLNTPKAAHPLATLRDTFPPTDRIAVTATMPYTSSNATELLCFNSDTAFFKTTSPTIATPGTGFLLTCAQTKNVAPCVISSKHIGNDIVVKFVVRGGDPRFYIVLPKGRQVWLSHFGTGKVGTAYNAQLQTSGGIAPFHWSLSSGTLPKGCTLNPNTGTISGKPTVKGSYPVVVQATDSERPPQTAPMPIPITIK
jgi:hypothetical protein